MFLCENWLRSSISISRSFILYFQVRKLSSWFFTCCWAVVLEVPIWTCLTAIIDPVCKFKPILTFPKDPFPITSPSFHLWRKLEIFGCWWRVLTWFFCFSGGPWKWLNFATFLYNWGTFEWFFRNPPCRNNYLYFSRPKHHHLCPPSRSRVELRMNMKFGNLFFLFCIFWILGGSRFGNLFLWLFATDRLTSSHSVCGLTRFVYKI